MFSLKLTGIIVPTLSLGIGWLVGVIFFIVRVFVVGFLSIRFRIQEGPAAVFNESNWVIGNGFHDLCPVKRLDAFRVVNVAGTGMKIKQLFQSIESNEKNTHLSHSLT